MSERFRNFAEQHLDVKLNSSKEWMCACPFCSGNISLQFNIDTGLWLCFRCDERGNAKMLAKKLGARYVDPEVSVGSLHKAMMKLRKKDEPELPTLPESTLLRYQFPNDYWTEERSFSKKAVAFWELGYDPITDRCTIPVRNETGELLGVIQRRLGELADDEPRYLYPKGFDRKASFFGSWVIQKSWAKVVALVEGSTDVISLWDAGVPALGQYGSFITEDQVRLLHRLNVKEVVRFYDYDEAGLKANLQAESMIGNILVSSVLWDSSRYCWRTRLCGCGKHDWRTVGQCQRKRRCTCSRVHEMDPGKLDPYEANLMFRRAKPLARGGQQ